MVVSDHLYGGISVPGWLHPVMLSPEVQRLRDVRLINTSSPSCPALSDVHRFTHTLGVLFLASRLEEKISSYWSQEDARAFLVAALLHDIGTPPFGHLFEYQLTAAKGWHHEKFVADIIRGTYRPEKRYHQIYYSKSLCLHEVLRKMNVNVELVLSLIRGESALGKILAGSIDLDNIDNVYRMGALLGLGPDASIPIRLVDSMIPDRTGPIFEETALPLLKSWQTVRRRAYEILSFDEWCLSGQAMLTECLTMALQQDILGEEHWFFTDDGLIRHLLQYDDTKDAIQRFGSGNFYDKVFLGWYSCPKGDIDLRNPKYRIELAKALTERTQINCCPYVFYDSGTFSKALTINIKVATSQVKSVTLDQKSESTIVAIFTPSRIQQPERKKLSSLVQEVLEQNGLPILNLTSIRDKDEIYGLPGQKELSF